MLILLTAFAGGNLAAQERKGWETPSNSFDQDLLVLRNNAVPYGFYCPFDNYTQYVPLAFTFALKACTYESRSGWGRMLTSDAFSAVLVVSTLEALKYSVGRIRPDGKDTHSFPSGHTALAFAGATALHHEYGWRSPWWSIGGYSVAMVTALGRTINYKHWVTDTFAGALIGIGCTELGYFLADLIFKDRYLSPAWEPLHFDYCSEDNAYYSIGPVYSRRFILGHKDFKEASTMPYRGSNIGLQAEIPVIAGSGVAVRASAGSLRFKDESSFNMYSGQAGMFWERDFAKVLELETMGLIGYAGHKAGGGIDLTASLSLNLITGNHCKIKALAEWETFSYANAKSAPESVPTFINSVLVGTSAVFYW